jgi:hypothetical protein
MHWTTVGELPAGFQLESSFIILRANKTAKTGVHTLRPSLPSLSRTTLHNHRTENSLYSRLFNRNNFFDQDDDDDDDDDKTRMLYECTHNNWLSNFVSTQPNCDGKGRMIRPAGHVYTSDEADVWVSANEYAIGGHPDAKLTLRPLFKCFISDNRDFFVSPDAKCEQSFAKKTQLLGYFIADYKPQE